MSNLQRVIRSFNERLLCRRLRGGEVGPVERQRAMKVAAASECRPGPVGLAARFKLVECTCDGDICGPEGERYKCEGCGRHVPWCFGAGDEHEDFCDDCVALLEVPC